MTGALTALVRGCAEDASAALDPGSAHDAITSIRDKLARPLTIALAGSVSSGKSTLVNALLGQRIAPVGVGECTRVVTRFAFDHHERAELVLRDGQVEALGLTSGLRIPDSFNRPLEEIDHVRIWLSNTRLQNLEIIDTPGLDTVSGAHESAAESVLGLGNGQEGAAGGKDREARDSRAALSDADALLYLMPHARKSDARVLDRYRLLFAGTALSGVNVVGVLTKIDRLADDDDPWPEARRIAERVRRDLRGTIADVIPVVGLLAETASADAFTERDVRSVLAVAAMDLIHRDDVFFSQADFLESDLVPLLYEDRRRLLEMLDMYGLRQVVEAIDRGAASASALLAHLGEVSGFEAIRRLVEDELTRRSDLLKAHTGMCDLRQATYLDTTARDRPHLVSLRNSLERISLHPQMHDLRVLDILRQVSLGDFVLPSERIAELEALAHRSTSGERVGAGRKATPEAITRAALDRATTWGALANDGHRPPAERRMAREVKESYELLYDEVSVP